MDVGWTLFISLLGRSNTGQFGGYTGQFGSRKITSFFNPKSTVLGSNESNTPYLNSYEVIFAQNKPDSSLPTKFIRGD